LLSPFLIFNEPPSRDIVHVALQGWPQEALAWAALKTKLIFVVAFAAYYMGFFFGPPLRIPHLAFPKPRAVVPKALPVVVISAVVFFILIWSRGGLTAHLLSWREGRYQALKGLAPIIVLIQCGAVASLIWFAVDRMAYRNPLFWVAVMLSVTMPFVVMGS